MSANPFVLDDQVVDLNAMRNVLLLALALTACAAPNREAAPPAPASTMRIHCINVGQGAATLFEFADGAVLVDTGGEDNEYVHSDEKLAAYLDEFFAGRP